MVHIRGRNGKKGASHGNNNVESRDENDTTNLPESIHICPMFDEWRPKCEIVCRVREVM